jgi:hypothetical protein
VPSRAQRRALLLGWYLPLVAGTLPVLLLGFGVSAIADRIAFVPWALATAGAYAFLLYRGVELGWERGRLAGVLALLLAAALAVFAALARRHHESFDLGFRALLPDLYRPAATGAELYLGLAAAFALAGAAALARDLYRTRSLGRTHA